MHTLRKKNVYMQIFMFVGVSVIEILLFNRKKNMTTLKISITCITPVLQAILDFFPDIISFQHVLHLGVGRSQIECKLKVKTQISVFSLANIGQNDHSNPYIESTTVLSDYCIYSFLLSHLLASPCLSISPLLLPLIFRTSGKSR